MKPKLFRDPLHNIIAFDLADDTERVLFELICTSTFQRLRRIRQLGFANLIYHGAEHSRFGHSLGVVHLARRMVDALGLDLSADDRQEVLCAALLHDIGHGPFSHAIEKVTGVAHEEFTAQAILHPGSDVHAVLARVDASLPQRVADFYGPASAMAPRKHVLRDIVSGQLDADRQDYILRDGLATGVKIGMYDLERILAMLTTYENTTSGGEGQTRLAVSYRAREAVEDYLIARFHMFKQVYLHKTVRSAEKMLEALLLRAAELYGLGVRWDVLPDHPLLRLLAGEEISVLEYLSVDDTDIWLMVKAWSKDEDPALRELSLGLLNRHLFKTIELDQNDPVLVARTLDQANEIAVDLGLNPAYAVLIDRARDTPYKPYDPSHPSISAHIPILERDGTVIHPHTGAPQGGVISPVLANIYLHYVLDLWFERVVKPRCE
ncbi:MAG: HD domain-containing protein, partial [Bradymonadaceae bacterium]